MTKQTRPCAGLTAATFAIGALAAQPPALAQQEGAAQSRALEEVLVTATRRGETDIQTTAVAVTSIGEEDIETLVPGDLGDLAVLAPNFSASRITAFNAASFAMRGVGQTDIIVYLDSPVGVTVDDFVMPSVQTQLLDMFDVASVEVLRGPQGTLFGKNTTGGAVTLRTKRPDLEQAGAEFRLRGGSFGYREAKLALDLPLIDERLGFRFAGGYTESDGYYNLGAAYGPTVAAIPEFVGLTGRGDGSDTGGQEVLNGRFKLLWQPTDALTALFQYEVLRDESDAVPSYNDTPAEPGCTPFVDCVFVWNSLGLTRDFGDPLDVMASTGRNDALLSIGDGMRVDVDGYYLNVDWEVGDYTVSSVTGYREQESRLPNTYTGEVGPVSLFDAQRDDDRETFQQEVRVTSNFDGPFNFTAGGFYQTNDATFCVAQVLGFLDMLGLGQAAFGAPDFFNNNPQVLCNAQDATAWAGFIDGEFDVTDRLTIGAGLRYTQEEKEWIGRNQVFVQQLPDQAGFDPTFTWEDLGEPLAAADFARFPDGVVTDEEEWSEPTWQVNASYQFTDTVFGYAQIARGFKSGGYNDQTGTSGAPIQPEFAAPYDPEYANSYEIGLKTDLFDDRLRFNSAIFFVNYEDAQRALVTTVTKNGATFQETRFFNAADVNNRGIELEALWLVSDSLTLRANAAWQDAEYDKFEADTNLDGTPDVDLSDRDVARTPELAWTVDLQYVRPLASYGDLQLNLMVAYEDEQTFILSDLGEQFDSFLDERTLVNATVTFYDADGRYYARVFGKNLTDERYRIASQPVANLWTHTQFGAPRNFGVEFGMNFGF